MIPDNSNHPYPVLRGPVPLTHLLLRRLVGNGSKVVDATCGNGKDTLLLAGLVGDEGHVWAFDIQQEALVRTAARLEADGLAHRVTLSGQGHERLAEFVKEHVQAIVFNLGWLPGSSREIATTTVTTIAALEASIRLLEPFGVLLITCYPGHSGGDEEAEAVAGWCSALPSGSFFVWRMGQLNVSDDAPYCLVVQNGNKVHEI